MATSFRPTPQDVLSFWIDGMLDYNYYRDKYVRTGDGDSLSRMLDKVRID